MKMRLFLVLTALAALASGCAPARSAAAPAEIPTEEEKEAAEGLKYVALTFDDGPRADTTGRLLDGLLERGVTATFFVIGEQIPGNEALLRRMLEEGHQIGNHTYSHVRLLQMENNAIVEEIHKSEVLLQEVAGERSFWLRPPYGQIDSQRAQLIRTPMIYWSVDPQDWKLLNKEKVVEAVLRDVGPGDIVLLHDFYPTSVDAALAIVDCLQQEGYEFVTVEELFRIQGIEPQAGTMYASPERVKPLK